MDKHLQKLYSFRADEDLILKLNYISETNSRTRNKEIEFVLKNYVQDYETKNGQLIINEDGTIKQIPIHKLGKSSNLKSG